MTRTWVRIPQLPETKIGHWEAPSKQFHVVTTLSQHDLYVVATLQQLKFVDSQNGCDNVVKQRCCIIKLQPTYNLKIKIALNFINVRSFKYQLNFFTLDFLKVIHGPLIFIFQLSLYFATTSFFVVAT